MSTENTQPEALRLANDLDEAAKTYPALNEPADELRRLHADNQVMLQALRNIIKLPGMSQGAMIICTAAILQATGEMP